MCVGKDWQMPVLNHCTGQHAGRKPVTPSEGVAEKSCMGTVKRNQYRIIKYLGASSRRASCAHYDSKGKEGQGLPEPDKSCGFTRSFQGMSTPTVKPPRSQEEGRREARGINILHPAATLCSPASASFIQTQLEAGGQGGQLVWSIEGHFLAHSRDKSAEWSAGDRRYPAQGSVGKSTVPNSFTLAFGVWLFRNTPHP